MDVDIQRWIEKNKYWQILTDGQADGLTDQNRYIDEQIQTWICTCKDRLMQRQTDAKTD